MQINFIEELEWRGMIHDITPNAVEMFKSGKMVSAYVGIDPTADSLHIGHLVGIMMLKHFQECGHKPIVLLGGATGMIGDPSGRSSERNLLDVETLRHNQNEIKKQVSKFLNFDSKNQSKAILVNNYDWMHEFSFLDFVRDVGKHITVNYMMAKESVKKRLQGDSKTGMSFTEFSYQLVQAYDFLHLYENHDCKLQMGGSDQWGNITTGTELIRRKNQGEAYALTCPLITKADGAKFGKTEEGNVWLDPKKTSPYRFYQFWLNISDEDAEKFIKIFTLLDKNTIENLISEHKKAPHLRLLQKKLAEIITCTVHSEEDYKNAIEASNILFGKATKETISKIDERTFLDIFEGVPAFNLNRQKLIEKITIVDALVENTGIFKSKGELRRSLNEGALRINKDIVKDENLLIDESSLINDKYVLVQKGKKNYFLIKVI